MTKPAFDTFNQNAHLREIKRCLRVMHGLSSFELTLQIGTEERDFLARYAKLGEEDRNSEDHLATALKDLLHMCMELQSKKSEAAE